MNAASAGPGRRWADHARHALEVLPATPHTQMLEHPALVAEALARFLP
jgi:pimeloyl-ACP methyl ester carboxylesterase